jgi:transposase InsO family protein
MKGIALGLKAVIRRKRASYVKAAEIYVAENVMNRNFDANCPNSKWCTDVTELKYGNGLKAYLSAIIDVYDNSIVSWVLSHSNNNKLVMDTLKRAYAKNLAYPLFYKATEASSTRLMSITDFM